MEAISNQHLLQQGLDKVVFNDRLLIAIVIRALHRNMVQLGLVHTDAKAIHYMVSEGVRIRMLIRHHHLARLRRSYLSEMRLCLLTNVRNRLFLLIICSGASLFIVT